VRIAFVSFEYPPFTPVGGIGTYVRHVSVLLSERGHHVEVFCGSVNDSGVTLQDGVRIERVKSDSSHFPDAVLGPFLGRHGEVDFDIVEGPDYGADTGPIMENAPNINHVIRLHSPSALLATLWRDSCGVFSRSRIILGAWKRGSRPVWHLRPENDQERLVACKAQAIISPSEAMAEWAVGTWGIPRDRIWLIPCPYPVDERLTSIPLSKRPETVSFVGRLDRRKGVHTFAEAVPIIVRKCPGLKIRFVGRSSYCPVARMDMLMYVKSTLGDLQNHVDFVGEVPLERMHQVYATTDICVLPSLWESYGLVLEAMLAGRAIVASDVGALVELLDHGKCGKLVPAQRPRTLANAIIELAQNPAECLRTGRLARERAVTVYASQPLIEMQEKCYRDTCNQHKILWGGTGE